MVLALQSYSGFSRFSAEGAIATVVVLSMTRELGPVMAGLMVADRLSEATRKMEALESDNQSLRESRNTALGQIKTLEDNFSRALDIAAEKMEELAK